MTYFGETPYEDGGYTVVEFRESGDFVTPEGVTEGDVLLAAGGAGGGGGTRGAGGGAGGVKSLSDVALAGTMAVTVGSGGTKGAWTTSPSDDNHGTAGGGSSFGAGTNAVPTMTAADAPSGDAAASSQLTGYEAWRAFDHSNASADGNCWHSNNVSGPWWLSYHFDAAETVTQYAITTRNEVGNQTPPKSWTFQGSNNGSSWDTLDTQTNVTDWVSAPSMRKTFAVASPASYSYYRLNISASNFSTDDYVSVGELELITGGELYSVSGGGFGSSGDSHAAGNGASGGGKWYAGDPGRGISGEGYGGGSGYTSADYGAGGGGGAGAVGGNGSSSAGGNGGSGLSSSITGTATYYGGGGSADTYGGSGSRAAGTAGQGGGGAGDNHNASQNTSGCDGTANSGGGGGANGNGGSGIVVIRYLTPEAVAAATLTIVSRHKVSYLATKTLISRHRVRPLLFVRKSITSRHLVGYLYTPPPARLAIRSRHRVLGIPGPTRLTLTSRHAVDGLVCLELTSAHQVRDVDPASLTLTSRHRVGFLAGLHLTSRHKVARRSHIVPGDPPVEVIDDVEPYHAFNGLNLNNGTTTHVLGKGGNVGADGVQYDMLRHYDGSRLAHDVQITEATITIPMSLTFTDGASLQAFIDSLGDACEAGGTYSRQTSESAPMRSYSILPSSPPVIDEDNRFVLQHVAYFDLVLTRWAE